MKKGIFSREAVLGAIGEYDRLGPDEFRTTYHYGPARDYVLVHEGRQYDSKAIAGVAHKFEYGRALKNDELSGGKAAAVAWLQRVGFRVVSVRNPDWAWDEVVLACALTAENGWKRIDAPDPRIIELSALLQLMPIHHPATRNEKFRNPNGVARKTSDLATNHPDYRGRRTNCGATDLKVIQAFIERPLEMAAAARLIRAGVSNRSFDETPIPEDELHDFEAPEGRLLLRRHMTRERNRGLRQKKIEAALRQEGSLACEVCSFDFEQVYGERGTGYIECHHVVPLHVAGEGPTKLSELALICANCHRMIHRSAPWPTPEELRALVAPSSLRGPGPVPQA
ncbi:HNH endonuclease [Streptomyces sp. NPDC059909]|uniref:HNH endonuclease n=1 Tax=Streptomyces sp. NPDC059909 TaxID=3346998 RepID=UPI00364D6B59